MGQVVQFPGRRPGAPAVEPWSADYYPHQVKPMTVHLTGAVWTPQPNADWPPTQFLAWQLGGIASHTGHRVPVQLRSHKPSGGPYALQVGNLRPITDLPAERASDILAGVLSAVTFLDGQL